MRSLCNRTESICNYAVGKFEFRTKPPFLHQTSRSRSKFICLAFAANDNPFWETFADLHCLCPPRVRVIRKQENEGEEVQESQGQPQHSWVHNNYLSSCHFFPHLHIFLFPLFFSFCCHAVCCSSLPGSILKRIDGWLTFGRREGLSRCVSDTKYLLRRLSWLKLSAYFLTSLYIRILAFLIFILLLLLIVKLYRAVSPSPIFCNS